MGNNLCMGSSFNYNINKLKKNWEHWSLINGYHRYCKLNHDFKVKLDKLLSYLINQKENQSIRKYFKRLNKLFSFFVFKSKEITREDSLWSEFVTKWNLFKVNKIFCLKGEQQKTLVIKSVQTRQLISNVNSTIHIILFILLNAT